MSSGAKLFFVITVSVAVLAAAPTQARTKIDDCAVLDVSGERYELTADVSYAGAGACLHIAADDVLLDLRSHSVTGGSYAGGFQQGIWITGDRATVKNGSLSGFTGSFPYSNAVLVDGASDVTLSNLRLSGNLVGLLSLYGDGAQIQRNKSTENTLAGVLLCGSDDVKVDENDISDNGRFGLVVDCGGGDGLVITGNQMIDNVEIGILATGGDYSGVRISGNRAMGSSDGGALLVGFHESIVADNNFSGNSDAGLRAYFSNGSTFARNTVSENSDGNVNGTGIGLEFSCGNLIEANVAKDNLDSGISLFQSGGNTVKDNRSQGNSTGIAITNFDDDPTCGGAMNLITGNSAMSNRHGIVASDTGHVLFRNTSRRNEAVDMLDFGSCAFNTWTDNNFVTANDPCIH